MNEKLSALMDGELNAFEQRRVLDALDKDSALRATWDRYHLARAVMRNDLDDMARPGFAERVATRLEALGSGRVPNRLGPVMMRLTGTLAIAASVAAIAIMGVQLMQTSPPSVDPRVASAPVGAGVSPVRAGATRWDTREPELERTLNVYLVEHNEFSSTAGAGGMLPYVRVVGYDTDSR